jgi:filamin
VLLPEDMVNPNVDALSVITYVSQFPEAELKPGAPIKEGGDPLKVKAYGDGLKAEGLAVSSSHVKFHVDVSEAKPFGSLRVKITGPNKMEIHSDVAYENDVYTYSYLPGEEGKYTIDILWWGKPIANSPFIVDVAGVSKRGSLPRQIGKVEAIKVYGPGIEGRDLRAKEPAEFWVEGVPSNMTIQVRVKGPKGQLGSNFIKVEQVKKTKYVVYYYPMVAGEYSVNVSAGSKAVASSPYTVNIAEEAAVQVVGWARGPGLEGIDMEAGKSTWFYVFIPTGLVKDISISIEGPKGKVTASSEKALESIYKFTYIPKQNGEYRIVITIGPKGRQLITLHFMVIVPSSAASAAGICKVWGTGVTPRGIQVNQRVQIHVQPTVKSDSEAVTMKITSGDKEIPAEMEEVNGVYTFSYCPPSTGKSSIEVFYGGNPLPNSPFIVNITDVSKIAISGLKAVLPIKQQLKLDVDASLAGSGALAIMPAEGNKKVISPKVTDKKDGFFEITLSPVKPCEEELIFTFDDVPLAQNPVILNFIDPSKVKVNGRGIQNGNVVDKPTYFMVDTTEAGIGDVGVELNGPVPTIVEISPSSEDKEGIFKCQYTPTQPGKYSADVTFSGIPTEDSPYEFEVKPVGETAQIAVYGSALESGLVVGTPSEFFIDLGDETPNDVEVYVESPAGEVCVTEQPLEDAITQYSFPVYQPGPYNFDIKIDDKSIEGFPVQTESVFPKDVPKVTVSGSGIEEAFVDETAEFEIDFHREGSGALSVSIDGPTKVQPEVTDGPNGTASVKYLPDTKGDYEIKVQFDDKEIAGCPFPVKVKSRDESETIKLEATGVKLGTDFQYNVDLSQANTTDALTGKVVGPFKLKKGKVPKKFLSNDTTLSSFPDVVGSDYTVVEPTVTEKDQIYSVQFTPDEVGVYVAYVFLGERLLDSMPYEISVCDPSQITVKGKGLNTDERESCYVNDPLKWEVDCTKAGPGTLTAYVAGPNKCSKKFKIKETSDDEYDVTYKPKQPGSYQMLFAYSGFDLPQKPTLMVSDPSKAQLKDSGMKICRVGEKVSFPVDLSSAGAGRLQANLEGPVEVPIEFTKNDDGTCVFSFTPTDVGKYALNVSFGDTPLSGEPMEVTAVDFDKVNLSGSGFNGLGTKVDQPATVTVDCTESGVAPLNATLTTPNETVLPLEFTPIDEAIFEAQYTPDEIGHHKLDVEFAGEPVKGSPFDVPIADPNKVKLSLPETLHAVPGETCQIEAFTESAGPGTISGVLSAPGTTDEPTPATVKPLDTEGNHYEVDFDIPPKPGVYQALVCYNDLPVCTPVDILCSGISLELDDIDVDQNGIGVEYTLDFFLPKVVPEEVTMKLISEEQQEIPLDFLVEKIDDDNCRVKYTPQDEGVFEASLCYAGNPLCDPFNITVINPENVQISGPLTEAVKLQADKETYLTVDTTEARSVEPAVRLLTPNETDFNKVPLNQDNPGVFTAKCTPTVVGSNEIEVKCCGRPRQYKFDVFNPSLVKCTPSSPETRCNIGEPVKLEFDVSEAGNGQFNLEINGPNECSVDNTVNDEGALVFVLNPTAAGVYEVEATLERLPCREEPMKVVVLDMDKMEISGSGATGRRARVGIPVEICIDLSKSGPVPIEATVARPSGDVAPLSFLPKEDEPEFLLATYTPESSGYHTVTFTIDEELYKEPMRAYIVNPEEFQIQPITEEPLEAIPGELNVVDLFLENGIEEDDRFEVILEDESGNESVIECKAVQVDDQHWKLEYMPEAESAKFVTLCYNEVPISEKIPIVQGSLSECTIEGIEPVVIVNQETSFTIDVTKATNRGSLSININQSDDTDIQVRIEEIDAGGVYKITYKPTIIGELSMKIKYGGLSFGKLPVVYAVDPSLVICTELNDKVVLVDEKIVFAVDTSEAGSGAELKINLEGPEGSDVSLQKVSDDNYSGVLSSSNPGACYLYITYGPGPISESPFVCGFKRPEPNAGRCQVPDMSIPGKFMVDCRDGGGNGVLEVAVYGAYVPAKYIAVEHNGDYTFNVSYDIPDPVETTISVKWHGEHLQGSPFKVVFKK